jgi:hypothetical protein
MVKPVHARSTRPHRHTFQVRVLTLLFLGHWNEGYRTGLIMRAASDQA